MFSSTNIADDAMLGAATVGNGVVDGLQTAVLVVSVVLFMLFSR
jgi:hypothetical protein